MWETEETLLLVTDYFSLSCFLLLAEHRTFKRILAINVKMLCVKCNV